MVRAWRFLQSSALVAVWIAIGWLFRLEANAYLLVGVPLLLVFHWGVRRQGGVSDIEIGRQHVVVV